MEFWSVLGELLILSLVAVLLATLFERLRQSAILGYLVAGALLGPHATNLIQGDSLVRSVAELGVSLLLFAIGLEFSFRRLLKLGAIGLGGGTLQILITLLATAGLFYLFVPNGRQAVTMGALVALSSTACVLRVLTDRAEIDSVYGRTALGILLLQDLAVVPLVLLVTMLGGTGGAAETMRELIRSIVLLGGMGAVFYVASNHVLPRLLGDRALRANRELSVLLAAVLALGSAWTAHTLGLSPALGAFIAGVLLAESPFALQVRVDIGALRMVFMTLFFASVGMLANPVWMFQNAALVGAVVAVVLVGKTVIVALVALLFRSRLRHAVAAGLCLTQVGEFSFVLASVAGESGLIDEQTFRLFVSVTLVTLLLTPYLVAWAPKAGRWFERIVRGKRPLQVADETREGAAERLRDHVIVIGFGPAGAGVTTVLQRRQMRMLVVDLHSANVTRARRSGVHAFLGDATHVEVLDHAHAVDALAVVVTLPDLATVLQVVHHVRLMAPHVPIIARARYHAFVADIERAGAHAVVDEEQTIGRRLGLESLRTMQAAVAGHLA